MPPFRSLRTKVTLSAVAILVSAFAVTYIVSYLRIERTFEQELYRDETTLLVNLSQRVSSVVGDIKWLSVEIVLSESIQGFLRKRPGAGTFDSMLDSIRIGNQLQAFRFSRDRIIDLAIIKTNGDVACYPGTTKEIMWKEWYSGSLLLVGTTRGSFTSVMPNPFQTITRGSESILCYIKRITDVFGPRADLGTLIITIDYRHIEELFNRIPKEHAGYILRNADGVLIYESNPEADAAIPATATPFRMINGIAVFSIGDDLVFRDSGLEDGWVLEKTIPKSYLNGLVRRGLQSIIIIGVLSVLVATATIVALMFSLTRSVVHLKHAMRRVSQGDLTTFVHLDSHDEMEELAEIFNRMVRDVRLLLQKVSVQEQQKKDAELKTLLMQINPHFLSNSLHSVVSLARQQRSGDIVVVANSLVKMLHSIMNFDAQSVSLAEELEYLENYIKMLRIRYGDLFDVSYEVDEDIRTCHIPKLLLQPLVENAIYHGILPAERSGQIRIAISRQADHLHLCVQDDGIGMTSGTLQGITAEGKLARADSFTKIGLRNVDERVRLCNGGSPGLCITSAEGKGTVITFLLPAVPQ